MVLDSDRFSGQNHSALTLIANANGRSRLPSNDNRNSHAFIALMHSTRWRMPARLDGYVTQVIGDLRL